MATYLQIILLSLGIFVFSASADNPLLVSINCGTTGVYTDPLGITWVSDGSYVKTGEAASVKTNNSVSQYLTTLRFFTSRKKNCYVVPHVTRGSKYLVRASFYYGNYDNKSFPPTFELQFDGNHWGSVTTFMDKMAAYEVIYAVKGQNISVCVAQTSPNQFAFMSSLEVRSLETNMYGTLGSEDVLFNLARTAFGSPDIVRYPGDLYDRIWYPSGSINGLISVTSDSSAMDTNVLDKPPKAVMLHAVTPGSILARNMTIPCPTQSPSPQTVFYNFYYAEVSAIAAASRTRGFHFEIDGQVAYRGPIVPPYQSTFEHSCTNESLSKSSVLSWVSEPNATVPPLVNAMEFFILRSGLAAGTEPTDLSGLKVLQDTFTQLQSWNGDPCLPGGFSWEWLVCNFNDPPRVTALYLNGSGLKGPVPDFSALSALKIIDLSNNSLGEEIPDFWGRFSNLTELNLAYNNFKGSLPPSLRGKTKFNLNMTGNAVTTSSAHSGSRNVLMVIGSSLVSTLFSLVLLGGAPNILH